MLYADFITQDLDTHIETDVRNNSLIWNYAKFKYYYCLFDIWTASSEFGTYRLCEQRRFRRACASAQSRQNLRRSLIQAVSQEEPSDRKPDPWPLWMAGHAQLKFVMTECSKTQIRLPGLNYYKIYFFAAHSATDSHIKQLNLLISSMHILIALIITPSSCLFAFIMLICGNKLVVYYKMNDKYKNSR